MSIKEDINIIKQELSAEEKFLETFIHIERFVKKYKMVFIAIFVIIAIVIVYFQVDNYLKNKNLEESNIAYLALLKNPNDKTSEEILKNKNESLYNAYLFKVAISESNIQKLQDIANKNLPVISDLATYQIASLSQNRLQLASYSSKNDAILRDFAILQEVYLLIKENNIIEAKRKLGLIAFDSPIKHISDYLSHYTIDLK